MKKQLRELHKKLRVIGLCYSVAMTSTVMATQSLPKQEKKTISIFTQIKEDLKRQARRTMKSKSVFELKHIDKTRSTLATEELSKRIELYQSGEVSDYDMRFTLSKANIEETKRLKEKMKKMILRMPNELINHYGEQLSESLIYESAKQEFDSAFTRTEKIKALINAVNMDLDHMQASSLKKIKWLKKEFLIKDLTRANTSLAPSQNKGFFDDLNDTAWDRLLLYSAATLSAVGIVAWGFASLKYGGRYNDKVDKMQSDFDSKREARKSIYDKLDEELTGIRNAQSNANNAQLNSLISNLQAQYDALNTTLTNQEMNYLSNNGFIYTLCNTYETTTTRICNNYDYSVYTGKKVCTVMCYKNTTTGKETLHDAPVCTNTSFPTDCYSSSKYREEYRDAYDRAYDKAFNEGEDDGEYDGKQDGTHDGEQDGYHDGYDDGYYDGNTDGYFDGDYDGYDDGYYDGYDDLWSDGYEDGYYWGYQDGQDWVESQDDDNDSCDYYDSYCDDDYYDDDYYYFAGNKSNLVLEALDKRGIKRSKKMFRAPLKNSFIDTMASEKARLGYEHGLMDAKLLMK